MRLRNLLCIFIISLTANAAFAQKRQYTMAEAVNGLSTTLAPKSIKQPMWRPGTHQFFYRDDNGVLKMYDADTRDTVIRYILGAETRKPGFAWRLKNSNYLYANDTLTIHSMKADKGAVNSQLMVRGLPKGIANLTVEPYTGGYAFTKDNNLFYGRSDARPEAVAVNGDKNIIHGQAVHRNEFGIDKGIFFSPKGAYLAYYRMDQTMVEDYPVIDWSVTPAKAENVKYPMAGRKSHEVTLQIYNITTKETIPVKTEGPKDQYLTCVTWSPDERYIYIAILARDQNHLWLNQYDARTGEKVKTILQEKDDKYVEPQHPLAFLPGSTTQFIWWSQRDGYMHLYLCDMAKNSISCLTPGAYVVNELIGFCPRTKEVLLTSAREDPREKHGYAVNWETGKMRRLDTEPGTHTYTASEDGEYLYDSYSVEISNYHLSEQDFSGDVTKYGGKYSKPLMLETTTAPSIDVVAKKSEILAVSGKTLNTFLDAQNPLANFDRPKIFDTRLLTKTGAPLFGRLILPTKFDENKKYPVIVYLYNGPHVQLVKNSFPASGNLWYEYLAQHGYIVWTMDGRGSSNRGQKFEQAVFRKLGTVEMEDQLQGVKFLKSLPYVDSTRIGVHGWSFGGFMTTSLMLRHPGVFKCAVAGGPVMDWSMYEIMYGERYMDTPEQNPDGYKNSALIDKVKNLKGKLLLIHGTQDATVVWQHSIKFLKAAVDAGKQVDYFVYPGYEHNVRGKDRVHLIQKITGLL